MGVVSLGLMVLINTGRVWTGSISMLLRVVVISGVLASVGWNAWVPQVLALGMMAWNLS